MDTISHEGYNVLSLFDGMSCGQIALAELGVKVNSYFASEIDKHAIGQTQLNFPNAIQLGSVLDVKAKDLPKIDIVLAGSPCQGFSFAGKGLNFNDPRSALFFEFVRILQECKKINPDVKFLLENVNMKKEHLRVISEYVGLFPVRINSNLVSAQNRDRFYWTNIRTKEMGLFDELWTDIPQPKDEGILLKDILQDESEVDEKYYIKNPKFGFEGMDINGKGNNLRIGGHATQTKKHNYDIIKLDKKGNVKADQDKAACFTAGGNSGGNHSDMDIICVAMRGRNPENSNDRTLGAPTQQRLEPKTDGKTNCLTSVAKDNLVMQIKAATNRDIDISFREDGTIRPHRKDYKKSGVSEIGTIGHAGSKAVAITTTHEPKIIDNYKLRRLTPTECARLQTIPSWYKWNCSDTQAYRMLGNGWTIKAIQHILSFLPKPHLNNNPK